MREELSKLEPQVGSRDSIVHFARAAISGVVGLLFTAAAIKLYRDSDGFPIFAVGANLVCLVALSYSLVSFLRARKLLVVERERVKRFLELRRIMGLSDPTLDLPR